jgi:hypothetical protein
MQPITRAFIAMNQNEGYWLGAGRKLAFPMLMVGYPQGDKAYDATGVEFNPFKVQAEDILANADPTNGLVFPYTLDPQGNIQKSLDVEFVNPGSAGRAYGTFLDFNDSKKNEIREMCFGGTLTSDAGKFGTKGLGKVHEHKLESTIDDIVEYCISILNDPEDFLRKLPKFYKNFPKGRKFDINRVKTMELEEIALLSNAITQNGKRLTIDFFVANGLAPEYIEETPQIIPEPKINTEEQELEARVSITEKGFFGSKKKLLS